MIYVDTLIDYGWKLGPSCHMIADTENELHEFALSIGLKRSWFQNSKKDGIPHYDLTTGRRKLAVSRGAKEINRRELWEMMQKYSSKK